VEANYEVQHTPSPLFINCLPIFQHLEVDESVAFSVQAGYFTKSYTELLSRFLQER